MYLFFMLLMLQHYFIFDCISSLLLMADRIKFTWYFVCDAWLMFGSVAKDSISFLAIMLGMIVTYFLTQTHSRIKKGASFTLSRKRRVVGCWWKRKIRYCVLDVRKEVLFLIVCYKLIFNEVYIYTFISLGTCEPPVKKYKRKTQRSWQKIG